MQIPLYLHNSSDIVALLQPPPHLADNTPDSKLGRVRPKGAERPPVPSALALGPSQSPRGAGPSEVFERLASGSLQFYRPQFEHVMRPWLLDKPPSWIWKSCTCGCNSLKDLYRPLNTATQVVQFYFPLFTEVTKNLRHNDFILIKLKGPFY